MSGERAAATLRERPPSVPRPPSTFALVALAVALGVAAAAFAAAEAVRRAMAGGGIGSTLVDILLFAFAVATLLLLVPAWRGWQAAQRAKAALASDLVTARVETAAGETWSGVALGYAAAALLVVIAAVFMIANDAAVARTFFYLPLMQESFWLILRAFWLNIYIFVIAEILVLVWGLVVAGARLIPGEAGKPIRIMATVYTDIFRGLPAIICIYLVGFGLPLTGLPLLGNWPP